MATLTEVSYYGRNIIKYGSIVLFSFLILRQVFIFSITIYKKLNPPPPPPPTRGFGLLPKIEFPELTNYQYQFQLQTPKGTLPKFDEQVIVYAMQPQKSTFSDLDDSKKLAKNIGFIGSPISISPTIYQWKMTIPAPLILKSNIITGAFDLEYQWQLDASIIRYNNLPGKNQSIKDIQAFFDKLQLIQQDINYDEADIDYFKASSNKMVPAPSLSEANFTQVNLFRKNIDNIPVLTPNPDQGIIKIIMSGSNNLFKKFVKVEYNYFPIKYQTHHTYIKKPITQAWDELINGQAYIAKVENDPNSVNIRRIFLSYYDSYNRQKYLQPIYVFKGDDGKNHEFVAYVSAIKTDQVQK